VEVAGSTILWERFIEQGVSGLRNLLIHERMLPEKMVLLKYQFFLAGRDDLAAHAPIEGMLTQHVSLGQAITKGEKLATIVNPLTRERLVIRSRECGVVHDLNVHAKVDAGDDIVGLMGFGACEQNGATPR